ncbi:MAG: LysR family transcriptional regulator [Burkholderiaceae bacterium]
MELRQLEQLVILSETLNFRIAAERLHMTQPPLSVSIRKLEEQLKVKLFNRTTHTVTLTEAGQAVLADARKALFHAEEVARVAFSTSQGLSGRLRLAFVGSAKSELLPRLLPPFRASYPGVALEVYEDSNTEIIRAVETGAADLGIVRSPFDWTTQLKFEPVEDDYLVIAMPAEHPLAKKRAVSLRDIENEPFIHYTLQQVPGMHALTARLLQQANVNPVVAQAATQVHTVICLVESGLGFALVPSATARHASDRVAFRPITPKPRDPKISLSLAYRPHYQTVAARRFREMAIHYKVGDSASTSES